MKNWGLVNETLIDLLLVLAASLEIRYYKERQISFVIKEVYKMRFIFVSSY